MGPCHAAKAQTSPRCQGMGKHDTEREVTRRGDGDTRGPAEPDTAGLGVWGGQEHPGVSHKQGVAPSPAPRIWAEGARLAAGPSPICPTSIPPSPLLESCPHHTCTRGRDPSVCPPDPDPVPGRGLAAPWLGIAPSPARGLRGSPPRCPYPTGLCWQEQPHTPSATPGCFWGHSSTWGHQNTPHG